MNWNLWHSAPGMNIRKIMLPLSGESDPDPLVESAFKLAAKLGATLEGIFVRVPLLMLPEVGMSPDPATIQIMVEEAERMATEKQETALRVFERCALVNKDVASHLEIEEGAVQDVVAHRGRLADLIVIGDATNYDSLFWLDARDAALFKSGRPVLMLPKGQLDPKVGTTLLVAWNDSVESARALSAAQPFIARAKNVEVVSVGDGNKTAASLSQVEAHLRLHHGKVKGEMLDSEKREVGDTLLRKASQNEGVMLVMGAYGHWRLKERLFGGVTERVLHEAKVPVLLAH